LGKSTITSNSKISQPTQQGALMVDIVSEAVRSRMMAGIPNRNTKPEMTVRRFLHAQGFRFRLHARSLPGCPDLVLPKYRVAIFVHGCFWHRHPGCSYATVPGQNSEKWHGKFAQNIERDQRSIQKLLGDGWRVILVWECGLRTAKSRSCLISLPDVIRNSQISMFEWPSHTLGTDHQVVLDEAD
jgi:DNA mismatch endonuclease (patch repair protein)